MRARKRDMRRGDLKSVCVTELRDIRKGDVSMTEILGCGG